LLSEDTDFLHRIIMFCLLLHICISTNNIAIGLVRVRKIRFHPTENTSSSRLASTRPDRSIVLIWYITSVWCTSSAIRAAHLHIRAQSHRIEKALVRARGREVEPAHHSARSKKLTDHLCRD
jgi:hypothetical protein